MKKAILFVFIGFFIYSKLYCQHLDVPILSIAKPDLQFVCNNYDTLIFALYIDNSGGTVTYNIHVFGQTGGETDEITTNFPHLTGGPSSQVTLPCLLSVVKSSTRKLKRYMAQYASPMYYLLASNDPDINSFAMFIQTTNTGTLSPQTSQELNPVPPKKPTILFR